MQIHEALTFSISVENQKFSCFFLETLKYSNLLQLRHKKDVFREKKGPLIKEAPSFVKKRLFFGIKDKNALTGI